MLNLLPVVCLLGLAGAQYTFDDSNGLGRRFDGIGGLSGGGATSKLLPGYQTEFSDQIFDYLFKPNFGAALQILKVEIGGGSMSGVGGEATHMYFEGDENYERGYEWWVMKEAKKRNPDIKLYGLPWGFAGWVGNGTNSPYAYPEKTVQYIVSWILGAKTVHNLNIDYIGEWNERNYNGTYLKEWNEQNYNGIYLKMLRKSLDSHGLDKVMIVAADDFEADFETNLARDLLLDPELSSAIDVFGVHYSSTQSNMGSLQWGKPLWASEDYSTFNDEKGARCWARILNQNYVNGLMTSTISWNLIAAYYEGMPYQRCGLMTANSPWSGHYDVNPTIWMTAHTTQFTEMGWMYLSHHSGVGHLVGGGSYVALASPNKQDLTIIIETIAHDDSQCLHEVLPSYDVENQTISFKLKGSWANVTKLYMWYSMLGNKAQNNKTVLFESMGVLEAKDGMFSLFMEVNQVVTLTTLATGTKGMYPAPPEATPFPLPYVDQFDTYPDGQEAYYVAPMSGSFLIDSTTNPNNKVLRQMTTVQPVDWCETENFTLALIGNISWTDIYVETSFSLDMENATEGVFLAQRVTSGGCYTVGGQGFLFYVFPKKAIYEIWLDSRRATLIGYGPADHLTQTGFNKLGLKVKDGFAEGYINDKFTFGMKVPDKPASGFAAFGTSGFGHADFDYVIVQPS